MTEEKVKICIKEAKEFIERAKVVLERAKEDKYIFFGCKETGALRRQSLELTRALAELRKW